MSGPSHSESDQPAPRSRRRLRRRGALDRSSMHFGPNMTPMVDVVMVILVFFMASAAFVGPEWFLKALIARPPEQQAGNAGGEPPKTPPTAPASLSTIRLTIAIEVVEGRTLARLNDEPAREIDLILASLSDVVRGLDPAVIAQQVEVLVRPGVGVAYRDVVRVHEGVQKLGIPRVGIAAEPDRPAAALSPATD
ncbi:MAG: ExbD/TolR family protein [Phycisphaerales bacterium]